MFDTRCLMSFRKRAQCLDPTARFDAQIENLCVSAAVLEHSGLSPNEMRNYFWPCRMERIRVRELDVIVDGAHNHHSVELLLNGLRQNYPQRRLVVLFGAGSEKSVADMIEVVNKEADEIIFVKSSHFKSLTEADLLNICREVNTHNDDGKSTSSSSKVSAIQAKGIVEGVMENSTVGRRLREVLDVYRCVCVCMCVCMCVFGWPCSCLCVVYRNSRDAGNEDIDVDVAANSAPVIAIFGSLFVAAEAREELFRYTAG